MLWFNAGSSTEHVADNMSKGSNLQPKITSKVFDGATNYIENDGSNGALSGNPEISINQNLSNQLRADQEELKAGKGYKLDSTITGTAFQVSEVFTAHDDYSHTSLHLIVTVQ